MTCTEAREMWKTMGKSEQTQWRTKAEDYNKNIKDCENTAADEADHDEGPEELEGVETEAVEVTPGADIRHTACSLGFACPSFPCAK